jgi:hypothetical protein
MRDWGESSIHVIVKRPGLSIEPENQKVLEASCLYGEEVRMRLSVGVYGPGTVEKPRPRIWWLLGESATVVCKDVEISNWFRDELMTWLKSLDGVVLEVVDGNPD